MKQLKAKTIIGIVLLFILTGLYGLIVYNLHKSVNDRSASDENTVIIQFVQNAVENALEMAQWEKEDDETMILAKTELVAATYRNLSSDEWEDQPLMVLENGAIIKVENADVSLPESFPEYVLIDPDSITGKKGVTSSVPWESEQEGLSDEQYTYTIYYRQIKGPFYYIEWEVDVAAQMRALIVLGNTYDLKAIEEAIDSYILLFDNADMDAGSEESMTVYYCSQDLEEYLPSLQDKIRDEKTQNPIPEENIQTEVRLGDASFRLYIQNEISQTETLAILIPETRSTRTHGEQTTILTVVFFILCAVFLVWILSILWLVWKHTLNEEQKKEFALKKVRKGAIAFLTSGGIAVFGMAILFQCLSRLYVKYDLADETIRILQMKMAETETVGLFSDAMHIQNYADYCTTIADLLSKYQGLQTPDQLQEYSGILGLDYLMIYDENGDESVTDSRYKGLSLSKDPEDSSYDFRRLLLGVPLIYHDVETDEMTGLTNMMIGACIDPADTQDPNSSYKALLMAVPSNIVNNNVPKDINGIMSSVATDFTLIFSVDPESCLVMNSNDRSLLMCNVVQAGIPASYLHDGMHDFFTMNGRYYYGEAKMGEDGLLYFCAVEKQDMYSNVVLYALLCALLSLVLMSVLSLYMLQGYQQWFQTYSIPGSNLEEVSQEIELPDGRKRRSVDPSKRWLPKFTNHGDRAPFHNAMLMLQVILAICGILVMSNIYFAESNGRMPLFSYILTGSWTRGLNLFALTGVFFLLMEIIASLVVTKLVIRIIGNMVGTRGETVCRLLASLLNYLAVIVFLFFSLQYVGIDTATLLASLGLLTFAISLGAKDLITDILAGISIIFEGNYQVGDIVEIDGYRGIVLEVGVRTTKLEGIGGNIKIIGNRDVKSVLNKTRKNSWYPLEFNIDVDQYEEAKQVLQKELPEIGRQIPQIISGPFFKGIDSFAYSSGHSSIHITILAECKESDYRTVRRRLNQAILELFQKHDLKIT